nr:hypothetical protein [Tanacetum cinerariifolium]
IRSYSTSPSGLPFVHFIGQGCWVFVGESGERSWVVEDCGGVGKGAGFLWERVGRGRGLWRIMEEW